MRLIDANILSDEFDPEDSMEYDAIGVRYIIDSAPTIDPLRAAGGCRCGECRHSSYDPEYNKRWCNRGAGCREVKAGGSGFCDLGVPREAQDDA